MNSSVLSNYKSTTPTRSCFLDGRYVDLVLSDVPEFKKSVIYIDVSSHHRHIEGSSTTSEGMNIFRVVIDTPEMSHSALVWVDTRERSITFTDVRDRTDQDDSELEYDVGLDSAVEELLKSFFSHLKYRYSRDVAFASLEDDPNCDVSGFCNAYVIKQVLDYVSDKDFDPVDIRRFAGAIETHYAHLLDPNTEPEVEYRGGRGGGGHGGGGGGYRGGGGGYRGGYGGYRGGYGRGGYGGAGLGLGLGVLGGVALGSALAQPYYSPYYPPPYYPYYPYY